jgi:hypothetical protein
MIQLPDLNVLPNETKKLPPRLHTYNVINIEKNATLKFNGGGRQWAVLKCNKLMLKGSIEYVKMRIGLGNISVNLDGYTAEYEFPESSIGGGGSNGLGTPTGAIGGNGFHPTDTPNGGGGGSGGLYTNRRPTGRVITNGNNATSYRGALTPISGTRKAGDGGKLLKMTNGGLLLIITNEIICGNDSNIILRGENGTNGKIGSIGYSNVRANQGNCGNGGGSAGGDGGVLIVKFKTINDYPNVIVDGGICGKGAIAPNSHYTQNGENGENGTTGYTDWIQI